VKIERQTIMEHGGYEDKQIHGQQIIGFREQRLYSYHPLGTKSE